MCQKIITFYERMRVLASILTFRHNKPLTGVSLSVPEPP
ncbi:conserved hypothetical protein [Planktothrix tepida PCC 9214]|uniref:Uncharacterized protein n=1 Tax=Planktothrix tepida PCC 9214 TaxID=671072 RepID=A0A1J1LV82_9CYAN|nr:conserved hypothetical protein [Planktothrix tepida PCC 9214]